MTAPASMNGLRQFGTGNVARVRAAAFGYHEVTDDPTDSGFQRPGARPYTLSRAAFADHLQAIAAGPVRPALVTDVDPLAAARHVLLTFDDGGRSALDAGAMLERHGWRGHFFIVSGRIGSPTFLDRSGIEELSAAGHIIGSHSHTHPNIFREQTRAQMMEEWRVSADRLAQMLGRPCTTASVPGGHISQTVLESAGAAGFRALFTCEPVVTPWRVGDCWVYGRYLVKVGASPARVAALAALRGWESALLLRRVKNAARRTFPALYRRYVASTTQE